MSHHLDTPLARQNGRLYIDDMYVFPGDASTVFVMDVNSTITGPDVQPGFHPEGRYEFKVHLDGADFEELTYRLSFEEAGGDGVQAYALDALSGADAREDEQNGSRLLRGRTGEITTADGVRVWAGRIADPFYIDLAELATIDAAVKNGAAVDRTTWRAEDATNSFADTTVESIVLEVSNRHPQLRPGARTGVWCTTKLATDAGGWRQVNRFGRPMMWPIFWPDDTDFSNEANTRHPSTDFNADGKWIAGAVSAVVAAEGSAGDPDGYGETVAHELLPDVLSYVVGSPASYGFAVRNGRTLADNAPEAMFSMILNSAMISGLKPHVNSHLRTDTFPYVVPA